MQMKYLFNADISLHKNGSFKSKWKGLSLTSDDFFKNIFYKQPNRNCFLLRLYQIGSPRGAMVKVMECGIVVSEFEPQLRYYIHFRANTLGKSMNHPYPPSYVLNNTTTVLAVMALALNNLHRLTGHQTLFSTIIAFFV